MGGLLTVLRGLEGAVSGVSGVVGEAAGKGGVQGDCSRYVRDEGACCWRSDYLSRAILVRLMTCHIDDFVSYLRVERAGSMIIFHRLAHKIAKCPSEYQWFISYEQVKLLDRFLSVSSVLLPAYTARV